MQLMYTFPISTLTVSIANINSLLAGTLVGFLEELGLSLSQLEMFGDINPGGNLDGFFLQDFAGKGPTMGSVRGTFFSLMSPGRVSCLVEDDTLHYATVHLKYKTSKGYICTKASIDIFFLKMKI